MKQQVLIVSACCRLAAPEVVVPASHSTASWLVTTYLDDTLRVARDDSGGIHLLLKELVQM
jgi:hypothetical protein